MTARKKSAASAEPRLQTSSQVNGREGAEPIKRTSGQLRSTDASLPVRRSPLARTGVRLAFLIPGAIALLAGLDAGLLLLGVAAPVTTDRLPDLHGPLMVFGFIGTVIALERAVAMRYWWGYLSPALLGVGGVLLLTGAPLRVGQWSLLLGCVVLPLIYIGVWRRQAMMAVALQALGAVMGVAATALWAVGVDVPYLVPSMAVFLILTIVGERVELARVVVITERAQRWVLVLALAFTGGALATLLWPDWGYPITGLALLAMVVWLLLYDVATRLVRASGLPRYIAACLLAGYFWLALAGGVWLVVGPVDSGPAYDAVLHAIFLGFTMSMIMAHAPVILPAVLRKPLPYRPILYLPVLLLNLSLVLRVIAGDGTDTPILVQWGGILNVVAVLLFVVLAAASVIIGVPAVVREPRITRHDADAATAGTVDAVSDVPPAMSNGGRA
ncbi:hypothetical protein [Homoserinimonas sp. OAct 916]|uniref:hypothetical protein n=1 Tax=Homoserinimonas sp. OAct 916 TaxID=2211450 RepID=UPI0018E4E5FE|nr:hypothetical protein [Homoserinimonas sp. OAct 916]